MSLLRPRSSGTSETSPRLPGATVLMAARQTTLWRWISGILGVTCLSLMATLGIVLQKFILTFPNTIEDYNSTEPTIYPGNTTEMQEDSRYSSCQERWVGYQCNCYLISSEFKTWNESNEICASQNSTLLQMDNRDELDFLKFNLYFYWIGVTYNADQRAWMWLNGSVVSQKLFPLPHTANTENCVVYSTKGKVLYDDCQSKNRYICK